MEQNELIAKINETLADEFEVEVSEITPEANIKETLQLDSLSLVDMVALIESEFGVKSKKITLDGSADHSDRQGLFFFTLII